MLEAWERQPPDWRGANRQSGDARSRVRGAACRRETLNSKPVTLDFEF